MQPYSPIVPHSTVQSWVSGYFVVMQRQASFFALVEYRKSILPQQKICLPCLTAKVLQHLPTQNSPLPKAAAPCL